ncbi:DUF2268 domain-containing protein [Bacillus taeanensis]|uniref:DUF2268 domain-containing protein n=1 Tax=Bacillus taeanensis TaxID=273032 RepID=A0A366XP21_9BACI|nr:DUF2268 domain-containing putative Zn-dependent protease [Bacillus taeanensis]RBW67486.1 hypothetical protein DS031_22035 [Bacillus taeanensis]
MPILATNRWLHKFIKTCNKNSFISPYSIQLQTLCVPLKRYFPTYTSQEVHAHLLKNGLFNPENWMDIQSVVKEMEKKNIWGFVNKQYQLLKKEWNGPEASIFIFPIKQNHSFLNEKRNNRNGMAFRGKMFLFVSPDVRLEELKALLAHEYNHICRLHLLNRDDQKTPLKDSLIIEGLGEYAVKSLYGKRLLGRAARLYTLDEALELWNDQFISNLNLLGKEKHNPFLYGDRDRFLPPWIGYYIGYQIVNTFQKKNGPYPMNELLLKSADELIQGSKFALKKKEKD